MNKKQELIEKYEYMSHACFRRVDTLEVLRDLKQLDEPHKVKVSEEEAKFLEMFDFNCESDVTTALYLVSRTGWGYYLEDKDGTELKDLSEGFRELENRKRLIKAILDGYEVEKEPKYTVKIKATKHYFAKDGNGRIYFSLKYKSAFTKIELEKVNLGWVFDCPGIEIEEVCELHIDQ